MTDAPKALASFLSVRDHLVANGWEVGAERRLADLMSSAIKELAQPLPSGVAVVATGGFGRESMAIRSDVDLLFLHEGSEPEGLVRRVLRPLWDANLNVGHLTHTPKGARGLAATRVDVLCTLLSVRYLDGDMSLVEELGKQLDRLLKRRCGAILEELANEELQRRKRERYRLMGSDLKTGRGGIRSLDMLSWRRRILEPSGIAELERDPLEEHVRETLTRIRSALHVAAGRVFDQYDFELRPIAARWLKVEPVELGRMVLEARSTTEEMVDSSWPEVSGGEDPQPKLPSEVIELSLPSRGLAWTRAARRGKFPEVLSHLNRLNDEPHMVAFHRFPVGDHILATVHQVWEIFDEDEDPVVREIVEGDVQSELLVWAAIVHDIGKGMDGDHAVVGCKMVNPIAEWVGLSAEDTGLLERLVENHLLLADLAVKLDVDDGLVLDWAEGNIVDLRTLRYLYLLTVADSRATGSDTWNPWRAELLRRGFRRVEQELVLRTVPEATRVQVVADRVLEVDQGGLPRDEVVAHLSGFGEAYRRGHTPEEIRDHVHLARNGSVAGTALSVSPWLAVGFCSMCRDRPRLLTDVAGILAVNRFSIVDARFATRSDGRAFDTFDVRDEGGDRNLSLVRIKRLEAQLDRLLRGGYDVEAPLAIKREAYRATDRLGVPTVVTVRSSGEGGGVIEVECADRVGLLHDLGLVIHSNWIMVNRARVDTRDGVAYDTFFVSRLPADITRLQQELESVCSQ